MDWTKQQGAECVTRCEWKRRMCYTVRVKAQNVLHGASESAECVTWCKWKHGMCYTVRVKARKVLHCASESTECVTRCEWKHGMCYTVRVKARNVLHGASECAGCVSAHEKNEWNVTKSKEGLYLSPDFGRRRWVDGRKEFRVLFLFFYCFIEHLMCLYFNTRNSMRRDYFLSFSVCLIICLFIYLLLHILALCYSQRNETCNVTFS